MTAIENGPANIQLVRGHNIDMDIENIFDIVCNQLIHTENYFQAIEFYAARLTKDHDYRTIPPIHREGITDDNTIMTDWLNDLNIPFFVLHKDSEDFPHATLSWFPGPVFAVGVVNLDKEICLLSPGKSLNHACCVAVIQAAREISFNSLNAIKLGLTHMQ